MSYAITDLYSFIEQAKKNRKYASNTAGGRRAALKIFEAVMNDDEKASLDLVLERIDQISNEVYASNKNKGQSTKTLALYRSRVVNLISDFNRYGKSIQAMNAWKPGRTSSKVKLSPSSEARSYTIEDSTIEAQEKTRVHLPVDNSIGNFTAVGELSFTLRPDFKFMTVVPLDLTSREADRIKSMIDSMVVGSDENRA